MTTKYEPDPMVEEALLRAIAGDQPTGSMAENPELAELLTIHQKLESFFAQVRRPHDDEYEKVWVAFKKDQSDKELRNQLILKYYRLAKDNAEQVWAKLPEGVDLNDLISAGVFGLMDAIEAFNLSRGLNEFEAYCVPRIRGAMLDELRAMDWVPRLVRRKAGELEVMASPLPIPARMGLEHRVKERTAFKTLWRNFLEQAREKCRKLISAEESHELDVSAHPEFFDFSEGEGLKEIKMEDLMKLLTRGLNRDEEQIMNLHYCEGKTMEEIAALLGRTVTNVNRMHSSIVARLQQRQRPSVLMRQRSETTK